MNPLDMSIDNDGNGWCDALELSLYTDLNKADTDGDRIIINPADKYIASSCIRNFRVAKIFYYPLRLLL